MFCLCFVCVFFLGKGPAQEFLGDVFVKNPPRAFGPSVYNYMLSKACMCFISRFHFHMMVSYNGVTPSCCHWDQRSVFVLIRGLGRCSSQFSLVGVFSSGIGIVLFCLVRFDLKIPAGNLRSKPKLVFGASWQTPKFRLLRHVPPSFARKAPRVS